MVGPCFHKATTEGRKSLPAAFTGVMVCCSKLNLLSRVSFIIEAGGVVGGVVSVAVSVHAIVCSGRWSLDIA